MPTTNYHLALSLNPAYKQVVQLAEAVHSIQAPQAPLVPAAYIVGGAVRDIFFNNTPHDTDIEVYNLPAIALEKLLRKLYPAARIKNNPYYGTWEIRTREGLLNISIPRTELYFGPHHTDVAITLNPYLSFTEALSRRDFTLNALLADPLRGVILDPYRGVQDIRTKVLRPVSPASFAYDMLRAWRAIQLVGRYSLKPTKTLVSQLKHMAVNPAMSTLSSQRILAECDKLCMPRSIPSLGLELAHKTGLLDARVPSLAQAATQTKTWQKLKHDIDAVVTEDATPAAFWQTILKALSEKERSALTQELMLPKKYRLSKKLNHQKRTS